MKGKKSQPSLQQGIHIQGARVHNLKNISLDIPHGKLVVITGVSGSGKSSLAFDTIYAEAQRRFLETLSTYTRQFVGSLERPDVDLIEGLSPAISIEQKTVSKNPRSTVGTITEIYDFMRLLFARIGTPIDPKTGETLAEQTEEEIYENILSLDQQTEIQIFAPIVVGRKGHYRELFVDIKKKGFLKVRVDGSVQEIEKNMKLDRYKIHNIDILIDHLSIDKSKAERLKKSLSIAFKHAWDHSTIICEQVFPTKKTYKFSRKKLNSNANQPSRLAPNMFSFNSRYGACSHCDGLGEVMRFSESLIVPNPSLSIKEGAISPIGAPNQKPLWKKLTAVCKQLNVNLNSPFNTIPKNIKHIILNGSKSQKFFMEVQHENEKLQIPIHYISIIEYLEYEFNSTNPRRKKWAESYMKTEPCPECQGMRLNQESLSVFLNNKNIHEVSNLSILDSKKYFETLKATLKGQSKLIGEPVITEIIKRLDFLINVGLVYLSISRKASTISGGEAQRLRLASQLGSQLTGVLYVLDEPSIGLHQKDNDQLIKSLEMLRDVGNTVLVVEHDKEIMGRADWIIDLGPGAGEHGGEVVAQGTINTLNNQNSTTSQYLKNIKQIPLPKKLRKGSGKVLTVSGCKGNNLKSVSLNIPLGKFILVTGVSGSGKSSLINETLYPILAHHVYKSRIRTLSYESVTGLEFVDKIVEVDQSPIGRTLRSNPATYTGVFTFIRALFTSISESKMRGYKEGRFSFNVKGGRCETCFGDGMKKIEMSFLSDVYVTCDQCGGKRYNPETLQILYKTKNINNVLNMTVEEALGFFDSHPKIKRVLSAMNSVGLSYIKLGQSSTTLSGGEAQRVKLSTELSKRQTGKTIYILDEPTTGLHFQDIEMLLHTLHQLVDQGNTVIVIEHNLDVIKQADWIIDMGPGSGNKGGEIIAQGTPNKIANSKKSFTGHFLKKELSLF